MRCELLVFAVFRHQTFFSWENMAPKWHEQICKYPPEKYPKLKDSEFSCCGTVDEMDDARDGRLFSVVTAKRTAKTVLESELVSEVTWDCVNCRRICQSQPYCVRGIWWVQHSVWKWLNANSVFVKPWVETVRMKWLIDATRSKVYVST